MKIYRWLITIFIIAVTISSLGFAKFQQIQAAMAMAESFPEPSAAVNSIVTEQTQYQTSEKTTGQISATQVVQLQNELAGNISNVNFSAGQTVEKGQVLLSFNATEELAQLKAAEASVILAQNNFERMTKLIKLKKISQQEYDASKAQLLVDQSSVENLKAIIAKKRIIAPFSGVVGLDTYQVGQFISANTALTTLVGNDSKVWIDLQLAQTKEKLKVGDSVLVKAINNRQEYKEAKIIAKNSQIKSQSRHMKYRAQLQGGRQWFEHNEIVEVKVIKPEQSVILVPSASISRNQSGDYLFALDKDDNNQYRARSIKVEIGQRVADQQVVLTGIQAGQLISTQGTFKLREGLLVYPSETEPASPTLNEGA